MTEVQPKQEVRLIQLSLTIFKCAHSTVVPKLPRSLSFQNCDKVPYVLKTDDDVFVNVRNLLNFVVENRKPNLLIGTLQGRNSTEKLNFN